MTETGKIDVIQHLVNDILNLQLDLATLKLEVANMGGRLLCHDTNCPHCPEIREQLRRTQCPPKEIKE